MSRNVAEENQRPILSVKLDTSQQTRFYGGGEPTDKSCLSSLEDPELPSITLERCRDMEEDDNISDGEEEDIWPGKADGSNKPSVTDSI